MSDIVERLRGERGPRCGTDCLEAADEVERLQHRIERMESGIRYAYAASRNPVVNYRLLDALSEPQADSGRPVSAGRNGDGSGDVIADTPTVDWKPIPDDLVDEENEWLLSDGRRVAIGYISRNDWGDRYCPTSDLDSIAATHYAPKPAPHAD